MYKGQRCGRENENPDENVGKMTFTSMAPTPMNHQPNSFKLGCGKYVTFQVGPERGKQDDMGVRDKTGLGLPGLFGAKGNFRFRLKRNVCPSLNYLEEPELGALPTGHLF